MNNDSIALSERAQAACADMRRASHRLALVLVELVDEGHLRHLGYASLTEYASTVLDLTPREARAFYRLGTAFPTMPALAAAMEAGTLDWTKAREILRVITPGTEAEWVARAQACTSRQLEREVSATPFGAPPPAEGAPIVPESQRGRLNLEGERSDIDTIRRAIAVQRARCGLDAEEIDDCALLALLALASIRAAEQGDASERAEEAAMAVEAKGAEVGDNANGADGADGADVEAHPAHMVGEVGIAHVAGGAVHMAAGRIGKGQEAPEIHEPHEAYPPHAHETPKCPEPAEAPPTAPNGWAQGIAARLARKHDQPEPAVLSPTGEVLSPSRGDEAREPVARWREPGERYRVVIEHCPDCGRSVSGGADVSESVLAQAFCDHERVNAVEGPDQGRASRAIAPRLRRLVFVRAGWRCEVPGCTNHLWLEVHHFTFVANGGKHVWWNLGVLCGGHHRAVHDGSLAIVRLPSGAIQVTHRDGRTYTGRVPTTHVGRRRRVTRAGATLSRGSEQVKGDSERT